MKKLALILAASWLVGASRAKAGELDKEYGGKAIMAAPTASAPDAMTRAPSELDAESPTQAWFHGRRFYGYGGFGGFGGFGFGGFGFGGFGYGYPGFGFGLYRGFYGYPGFGFGGFGYGRGFGHGGFGRGFGYGRRW